jgi:hypothetical protein
MNDQDAPPVIVPVFAVKCQTRARENHYLNFCASDRVDEPHQDLIERDWRQATVTLVLDEARKRRDERTNEYE